MGTDRHGNSIEKYPSNYQGGTLLGITNDGVAAYHNENTIFFAELKSGEMVMPPEDYLYGSDVSLEAFDWTVGEFLRNSAKDEGLWREATDYALSQLSGSERISTES